MIVLVGFMGAGKTTVGRLLATRLGLPFVDTDHVVEARAGRPVREIFTTDGEATFRDLEQAAVEEVLAGPQAVVSLGGGACGREATREVLREHVVVHLDVSLPEVRRRTAGDVSRPVLRRPGLEELHAARRTVFHEIADVEVPTDGRRAEDVAGGVFDAVAGRLAQPENGARDAPLRAPGRPEAGIPAADGAPAGASNDLAEDR
ncbi:shikimate kinase [Kineococcus radiotolerans]|uniref:Shikimate kinase n=1 Tax=Kineococcus radiotolerans (strain ATCC BAA-149 / DSM 14245 / SRS30216) TaxID=266940 RepID=A6WCD9_KINRD|nr:shikimate kinase [Kineococcus radiotolerans]ABS04478.1 Shikimate kinase [Kineococcus radiotolerans SRS30216 = ATCC BAA-149]